MFLVQNIFGDSKTLRTVSLKAHYFINFRNLRHQAQVQTLLTQIMPAQTTFSMDAYKTAVERPFDYLVIQVHPRADPVYALRTNILPTQKQ